MKRLAFLHLALAHSIPSAASEDHFDFKCPEAGLSIPGDASRSVACAEPVPCLEAAPDAAIRGVMRLSPVRVLRQNPDSTKPSLADVGLRIATFILAAIFTLLWTSESRGQETGIRGDSGGVPAIPDVSAPTTPEEVRARVAQLREHYATYLRSLPKVPDVRPRVDLSGTWRSKFEVARAVSNVRPPAPDWWRVDLDESDWEQATVPQWRYGMENPKEKVSLSCILWYRTGFDAPRTQEDRRVFLVFGGAEWEAEVWLNGTFLGRHQGYHEPFRLDATAALKEKNVLAVRVISGPRFGQPVFEWSLLPDVPAAEQVYVRDVSKSVAGHQIGMVSSGSGFGIHREVFLETSAAVSVSDIFVRSDLNAADAKVAVEMDSSIDRDLVFDVQMLPENFEGPAFSATTKRAVHSGTGRQDFVVPMPGAKRWQPDSPCLYRCRVTLRDGGRIIDAKDTLSGFRSFEIVSAANPRPGLPAGMFLLNGQPVFVRGTDVSPSLNAFSYWHQNDKLIDAVLMAKAANFNAIRACEHVNFPEVRELFDRLGMMSEQDQGGGPNTPQSGYTNGNTPADIAAMARAGATLARVCYNNPGVVLLSVASETHFDPKPVIDAVRAVDPQRVLAPISGNMNNWGTAYDGPPGFAFPPEYWDRVVDDFHCYNGWYSQKAQVWKFNRRRAPAPRLVTVGEFGAEGIDAYPTMAAHYPPHFKPVPPITADVLWGHVQVQKADPRQIIGLRGRTPGNLGEYIEASQNYQADVLAETAAGFRLSPRFVSGYFAFHFIDALPAHWPKSIVSHDFTPKKGYYEMAQVNQPVVPLFQISAKGQAAEIWVANDLVQAIPDCRVTWKVDARGKPSVQGEKKTDVPALDATRIESIDLSAVPAEVSTVKISLSLSDSAGKLVARYQRDVFLKAWRLEDAVFPIK